MHEHDSNLPISLHVILDIVENIATLILRQTQETLGQFLRKRRAYSSFETIFSDWVQFIACLTSQLYPLLLVLIECPTKGTTNNKCPQQTQITRDKETVAVAVRGLEEQLSRSSSVITNLEARVHEAESAKLTAEQRTTEISQNVSKLGVELSQVREESTRLKAESRANRTKMESINAELETLREKYTTLKRRYADAGRKVRTATVRGEVL